MTCLGPRTASLPCLYLPTASESCRHSRSPTQPNGDVRALLDRQPDGPTIPIAELTAADVRADDASVVELQRDTGPLHAVEDITVPGAAEMLTANATPTPTSHSSTHIPTSPAGRSA